MRAILRSKQWNYTQNIKKNNKIRIFIFFIPKTMAKQQKWKNIKKLPEKNTKKEVQEKISPSPLELWLRQIDKNVEFLYEEINQRELSLKDKIRLDDMEYDIKSLFEKVNKRNYIIPVVNILWGFWIYTVAKIFSVSSYHFWFLIIIGLLLIAEGFCELFRD